MAYVFGEILVWLLLAVAVTAVTCWLLWRWRVQRVPYEEWAAMEIRAAGPSTEPAVTVDETEVSDLRAELARVIVDRDEQVAALEMARNDLEVQRVETAAAFESAADTVDATDATDASVEPEAEAIVLAARAEMEVAARRVGELTAALEAERRRNASRGAEIGPTDASGPDTGADVIALQREVEAMRSSLRERDERLDTLQAELDVSEQQREAAVDAAEVDALRARVAELQSAEEQQAGALGELAGRAASDAAELLTSKQRAAELEHAIAELRASTKSDLASREAELAGADRRLVDAEHRLTEAVVELEQLRRELEVATAARSPFDSEALAQREQRLVADLDASAIRIKELEMALAESLRDGADAQQVIDVTEPPPTSALELARRWSAEAPDAALWDDLTSISGVGPKLETLLRANGIYTFDQVASLTDAEVDELQAQLPEFPGRIRRDAWVEQAKRLLV